MNKITRKLFIGATTVSLSLIALNVFLEQGPSTTPVQSEVSSQTQTEQLEVGEDLPIKTNAYQRDLLSKELTGGEMLPHNPLEQSFSESDHAFAWAKVDLGALRNEMPDNLYWVLAAPTSDEVVREQRKELKEYWQQQYAKVLSNTATETEIRAYFEHRHQVSSDYIKFATSLLNRHSTDLPERDYHFQVLARNLHLAQLEELPKKLQNALENKARFEQRRNEWLADKSAYEAQLQSEREEALRALGKI